MLANIWNAVLYHPLLNALAFLVSIIPGGDVGIAIIILTLFVKILLFPLSQKSIEIPIIFALYYVFYKGIDFQSATLYSFVNAPEHANMIFLGILDISQKSVILAILAGVSQYLQAYFMPQLTPSKIPGGSFSENFAKSMQTQMKYVFPFVVAFIAYSISGAVAIYWITSNLFMVGQQIYVKKEKNFKTVVK